MVTAPKTYAGDIKAFANSRSLRETCFHFAFATSERLMTLIQDMFVWDFDYKDNQFKAGLHQIAVKVEDNDGLDE